MGITFVELCAGSAAVSLHLLGGEHAKPPAPYQGSKRAYAASLLSIMGLTPGQQIGHLILVEPGPWAAVWQVLSQGGALDVVAAMEPWCVPDPQAQRATFDRLRDSLLAGALSDPVAEAAAWLWVLARSMNSDPLVGTWMHPEIPGRTTASRWRYKADKPLPQVAALAGLRWPTTTVHRCSATQVQPVPGAVAYMDPPYKGTSGYLDDFPPAQVRQVAEAWYAAGASVYVSEARRVVPGWRVQRVQRVAKHNWSGKREEFVTHSPV